MLGYILLMIQESVEISCQSVMRLIRERRIGKKEVLICILEEMTGMIWYSFLYGENGLNKDEQLVWGKFVEGYRGLEILM